MDDLIRVFARKLACVEAFVAGQFFSCIALIYSGVAAN